MIQKFGMMLAAAAALSLASADSTYNWTGGDATLGDGVVIIVCEAGTGNVTSLVANAAAGAITLTGVPMTFADGATVTIASTGTLSVVQKATALGALTIARGDDVYKVWTGNALTEPEGASMPLVFPGLLMNDIDLVRIVATSGVPGSGRYDYLSGPDVNKFYTFNRVTASAVYSLRVQLQEKEGGLYARCRTGVRSPRFGLYPNDEGNWATAGLWEYFSKATKTALGCGLYGYTNDPPQYGGIFIGRMSSLGITKIVARRKGAGDGKATVRFEGGATFGGTTTIAAGVETVLAVSEGDGAATLANAITGDGDLTFVPQPTTIAYAGSTYREDFISSTNWIVIATNRSLSTLTGITGYMQGKNHNATGNPSLCGTYGYSYNAVTDTATMQFQFNRNPGVKVVNATLRQRGPNIEIHGDSAGYDENASDRYMKERITSTGLKVSERSDLSLGFVANNYTDGYGIRKLTATFGGTTARGYATVSGNLTTLYGGKITVDGSDGLPVMVTIASQNSLPTGGEAHACTNAELRLYALDLNSDAGIAKGSTRLVAHEGGLLHQARGWQIRSTQDVVLDGGTLQVDHVDGYIQFLTLSGAVVTNTFPRSAFTEPFQNWRVVGTKPSFIRSGVNIYGTSSYALAVQTNRTFHIDVEDVTGDDAVDCTVAQLRGAAGRRADDREPYAWFMFEKWGAGTLELTGDGKEVRMPATIGNGTFRFGAGSAMTNDFVLAGGNLAAATGSSNALGALTVNTNATLTVETGGQLAFASFTAGAGLSRKAITIDAPLDGNLIRFGTDASGLAPEQLRFFRWKDGDRLLRVSIDENGYLHPFVSGMIFTIL
ncbi:MAG: hypothetical protein IJH50_13125 [Kiritimatiellae bacterium]|nr:hypothetical protein [Kiritimatiellia bacterium]